MESYMEYIWNMNMPYMSCHICHIPYICHIYDIYDIYMTYIWNMRSTIISQIYTLIYEKRCVFVCMKSGIYMWLSMYMCHIYDTDLYE